MAKKPYEIIKDLLAAKPHAHIKLLGDSITHGVGGTGFRQNGAPIVDKYARNPDGYCWANKFKAFMETQHGCTVNVNACTGTRIEFVIEHFDTLVSAEDDLIICTIGTNNRHRYFREGEKPTREEMGTRFYQNVVRLHELLVASGKAFILMANIPAGEENERDGTDYWRVLHMDDINAIYEHAATVLDFPLISMYRLFGGYCADNGVDIDTLLADALHPNDRGYDVMYDLLLKELHLI